MWDSIDIRGLSLVRSFGTGFNWFVADSRESRDERREADVAEPGRIGGNSDALILDEAASLCSLQQEKVMMRKEMNILHCYL